MTVTARKDFRLMLHRHWNLYDAMQYSPYVAPRMQVGVIHLCVCLFVCVGGSVD